jgi:hypothetical protein
MSASKKRLREEQDDIFKSRLSNPLKVNVKPVNAKKGDNKKFTEGGGNRLEPNSI